MKMFVYLNLRYCHFSDEKGLCACLVSVQPIYTPSVVHILREKSLAISYNGFSHRRSFKHQNIFISWCENMSVV